MQQSPAKSSKWLLEIRAEYSPNFRVEIDNQGKEYLVNENGTAKLHVPAEQVALVLLDTWGEPNELVAPKAIVVNQKRILEKCRQHGVTIIHAPNHPVVEKYPQYQKLKDEVAAFAADFQVQTKSTLPFMQWPARDNSLYQQIQDARKLGREAAERLRLKHILDISQHLTPLPGEYVLASHLEFRYVLWREKITLLLYIGKSLNECFLHRDTGINLLAGIDTLRVPFTIVVLKDCAAAGETPEFNRETVAEVMLAYYRQKIALVADSNALVFSEL